MKDFRQIEGMRKQMTECLENAYTKGYKQGVEDEEKKRDAITDKAYYDGYNKGVFEAWDCARKLFSDMSNDELNEIFPYEWNNGGFNALIRMTPQDAISRLEYYEKNQKQTDKIRVGDEVRIKNTEYIGIVHHVGDDWAIVETFVGGRPHLTSRDMGDLEKTDNHYNELATVLEKIKESEGDNE